MVEADKPVAEKETLLLPSVAICAKVVPSVDWSTLKPFSLLALSVQERLIWLLENVVAVRFVGAAGGTGATVPLTILK